MKFINYGIGNVAVIVWIFVIFPAFWICGIQVKNHGTLTIYTGSTGIRITGLDGCTVTLYQISIVDTI